MNRARLLTSPHILEELLATLRAQGLMPSSLRLIGLLGVGNNATVFSATIDGVYHVLKVYSSKTRMHAELRHLRKITPPDRQLFIWEEPQEGSIFHFFIVEMPPGHQLRSADLTPPRMQALVEQMVELHRVRFKQRVSVTSLRHRLRQCKIALDQWTALGLDQAQYQQLFRDLERLLDEHAEAFRVKKSRIHGDLWWPNIIATPTGAYLIDWDEVRRADAAEDIAKLRIEVWFSQNAFPSRNFFWSAANHGARLQALMRQITAAHEAEFGDDLLVRLRFYLPLYGLYQLAKLAIGGSITEPILRPSLYRLLAQDIIRLAADPLAPVPDLRGGQYYGLVRRSRTERLDELPPDYA
ncbi:MAG TPA: aminoglycoside phosphotransferase family protein [Candidatus Saccharimonadia bacterium]|nr:aminoglycoside phosphotransferase family protein [Candidatus Saccharimonadia bacterium]